MKNMTIFTDVHMIESRVYSGVGVSRGCELENHGKFMDDINTYLSSGWSLYRIESNLEEPGYEYILKLDEEKTMMVSYAQKKDEVTLIYNALLDENEWSIIKQFVDVEFEDVYVDGYGQVNLIFNSEFLEVYDVSFMKKSYLDKYVAEFKTSNFDLLQICKDNMQSY